MLSSCSTFILTCDKYLTVQKNSAQWSCPVVPTPLCRSVEETLYFFVTSALVAEWQLGHT